MRRIETILFLDIDGVLNSSYWFKSIFRRILIKLYGWKRSDNISLINPYNLYWVGKFCKKINAKVVLDSSWRVIWNRQKDIDKLFKKFNVNISDITHLSSEYYELKNNYKIDYSVCHELLKNENTDYIKYFRGNQILYWLESNYGSDWKTKVNPIILEDDISDVMCFEDLKPYVIRTYFYKRFGGFRFLDYLKGVKIVKKINMETIS